MTEYLIVAILLFLIITPYFVSKKQNNEEQREDEEEVTDHPRIKRHDRYQKPKLPLIKSTLVRIKDHTNYDEQLRHYIYGKPLTQISQSEFEKVLPEMRIDLEIDEIETIITKKTIETIDNTTKELPHFTRQNADHIIDQHILIEEIHPINNPKITALISAGYLTELPTNEVDQEDAARSATNPELKAICRNNNINPDQKRIQLINTIINHQPTINIVTHVILSEKFINLIEKIADIYLDDIENSIKSTPAAFKEAVWDEVGATTLLPKKAETRLNKIIEAFGKTQRSD